MDYSITQGVILADTQLLNGCTLYIGDYGCFEISPKPMSRKAASSWCSNRGKYLVKFNTTEEFEYVRKWLNKSKHIYISNGILCIHIFSLYQHTMRFYSEHLDQFWIPQPHKSPLSDKRGQTHGKYRMDKVQSGTFLVTLRHT